VKKLNLNFEKLFLLVCVISILLTNNFVNLSEIFSPKESSYTRVAQNLNLQPEDYNQLKYVDSSCENSFLEFFQNKSKVSQISNHDIALGYYNEITGNPYCHNRLIKSNSNYVEINENSNFSVGIGIFEDLENVKRAFTFNLLFFLVCYFYSRKNDKNNNSDLLTNIFKVNLIIILYSTIAGLVLTRSITFFLSTLVTPLLIQTNLLHLSYNYFKENIFIKSVLTLSFLPLLFFHSSVSFYTSIAMVLLANTKRDINVYKNLGILFFPLIISFIYNFRNLSFSIPKDYDYSILLQSGFFQNSIINQFDGYKSILNLLNLFLLSYLFIYIFKKLGEVKTLNSISSLKTLLNGFVIWTFFNLITNFSPYLKFLVINSLGLSKSVDTKFKFMWSGFNVGYEMTSFWFLILLLICTYLILNKEYIYLFHFFLLIFFTNQNGSRTAFILFLIFIPFIGLIVNRRNAFTFLALIVSVFVVYNLIFPQTIDRVITKTFNADCEISLSKYINESSERVGRDFNLSSYDLTFEEVLIEKTNFNSINRKILNQISCVLGRQVEWARFFIISEFEEAEKLFGHGYGQSYEVLVEEIQKPHSLFLTLYYQVGLFGLFYYSLFLIFIICKKLLYSFDTDNLFQLVLIATIILNATKTEFIFTFWGTAFTLSLFSLSLFNIKK
jgi:hypothetical protein